MKIPVSVTRTICAIALVLPHFIGTSMAQETAALNIALGKKVTAQPLPNSGDTGNKLEMLTDGNPQAGPVVSQGTNSMWVQPTAVSWSRSPVSCLIVDLESVQPISGFAYNTAAGVADVSFPNAIYMLVSDDQKNWRYAGDLVKLSAKDKPAPAYGEYHEHKFSTRDVQLTGRYVAFGITSSLYTVTDEIKVYAGDKTWLGKRDKSRRFNNQPADLTDFMNLLTVQTGIDRRITNDLNAIKDTVEKSSLSRAKKTQLLKKVDELASTTGDAALPSVDFRTIMPLSDLHRQVLCLQGESLAAQGFEPLTVWGGQRYKWLDLIAAPDKSQKPDLVFSVLGNQFRSQSLLLTNASAKPQKVRLQLTGAPKGARAGWLKVDEVYWTDTYFGTPVPDALKTIAAENGAYSIDVPAGMTRKVWLTVDSSKLSPGDFKSTLVVDNGIARKAVPFSCAVSTIAMKRPRFSLGMWDESNGIEGRNSYAITAKNYVPALKLMQSHYVDAAWGSRVALPVPGPDDFDAQGALKGKLDFSAFEKWAKDWPEARHFFVFMVAGDNFGGEKMDSPLFAPKLGSWAKAVVQHMRETGRDPKQIGLMLVDEAHTDAQDVIQVAWSRAIKATAPELQLFTDPLWEQPGKITHPEAISNFDILSPNLSVYQRGGESARKFYEGMRQQGKSLWTYQCDGPTRMFDPQRYFRYNAWHTFAIGGEGQGFWSFGDAGKNSWNEYANISFTYAPVFIDQTTVTNSIHWDSVRDGVQDFEELAMLRDAIAASKDPALKAEGQRVLDNAVKAVTGIWKDKETTFVNEGVKPHYDWRRPDYDVNLADRELKKVRFMLEKFNNIF